MPINIPDGLPAFSALEEENIFVMKETRAISQDIRPLKIAILNLMPTKVETEIQLMRLLSNTPLQIDITLLIPATHKSKNTSHDYLERFYKKFDDIKDQNIDGLIITGAPLEDKEFEEVDYWPELCGIMDWSKQHVTTTIYICWASLAGLYHHYGIQKHSLPAKKAGIFNYRNLMPSEPLLRGVDDVFKVPQSRYATVSADDILKCPKLQIAAMDENRDPAIIISDDQEIFITGHMEYDVNTLANEYQRDVDKGITPAFPLNYYPDDDPRFDPVLSWRTYSTMVFTNWLNYYVYQLTPYDLKNGKIRG
ncbi:MAG: homoserine O-succinyltransferase [Candidatus Methanomethylophilaceae archaeon]|nr:homoserine O-succinyltransferase [Candidatus Methanomethylophilaceae archaeon]